MISDTRSRLAPLRGYLCVFSAILANIVKLTQNSGLQLCAGAFLPYVASYLYYRNPTTSLSIAYSAQTYVFVFEFAGVCKV